MKTLINRSLCKFFSKWDMRKGMGKNTRNEKDQLYSHGSYKDSLPIAYIPQILGHLLDRRVSHLRHPFSHNHNNFLNTLCKEVKHEV